MSQERWWLWALQGPSVPLHTFLFWWEVFSFLFFVVVERKRL